MALDISLRVPSCAAIRKQILSSGRPLAAPELIDLEVMQSIRRQLRIGKIKENDVTGAFQIYSLMDIKKHPHSSIFDRIWQLRHILTACDAAYFALAELLDAPLWTRDRKFMTVPGHEAVVNFL